MPGLNKGVVIVLSPSEFAALRKDFARVTRAPAGKRALGMIASVIELVVHGSVDTDLSTEENPSSRMLAAD